MFQPYKSHTQQRQPKIFAGAMADEEFDAQRRAQRFNEIVGASQLYNAGMGDRSPIADFLRDGFKNSPDNTVETGFGDTAAAGETPGQGYNFEVPQQQASGYSFDTPRATPASPASFEPYTPYSDMANASAAGSGVNAAGAGSMAAPMTAPTVTAAAAPTAATAATTTAGTTAAAPAAAAASPVLLPAAAVTAAALAANYANRKLFDRNLGEQAEHNVGEIGNAGTDVSRALRKLF